VKVTKDENGWTGKLKLDASDVIEKLKDVEKTIDRLNEKANRLKATLAEVVQTADDN